MLGLTHMVQAVRDAIDIIFTAEREHLELLLFVLCTHYGDTDFKLVVVRHIHIINLHNILLPTEQNVF